MAAMTMILAKKSLAAMLLSGTLTQATPIAPSPSVDTPPQRIDLQVEDGVLQYLIEIEEAAPPDIILQWC